MGIEELAIKTQRLAKISEEFNENTFEELVEKAKNSNEEVRLMATSRLGNLEDPCAIPHLLSALEDNSARVRAIAVLGLGTYKAVESKQQLIDHLQNDPSPEVRAQCAQSLADVGHADSFIIQALADPDWHVKVSASVVLGAEKVIEAAESISQLLDYPRWDVRYFASTALIDLESVNLKVIEALSSLRDIPEAIETLKLFAHADIVMGLPEYMSVDMDACEDESGPEMLDRLRMKYGEKEVPFPSEDPLGDIITQAYRIMKE